MQNQTKLPDKYSNPPTTYSKYLNARGFAYIGKSIFPRHDARQSTHSGSHLSPAPRSGEVSSSISIDPSTSLMTVDRHDKMEIWNADMNGT